MHQSSFPNTPIVVKLLGTRFFLTGNQPFSMQDVHRLRLLLLEPFFFHFCFIFTNYLQLNYWQNNNSYHPFFHRKGHGRSMTFVTMQDFDWISVNDLEVTHFSFRIRRWRGEMIYAFLIFVFRSRQGLGPIHLTCPPWKIVFNFGIRRCATPSLHSCLH